MSLNVRAHAAEVTAPRGVDLRTKFPRSDALGGDGEITQGPRQPAFEQKARQRGQERHQGREQGNAIPGHASRAVARSDATLSSTTSAYSSMNLRNMGTGQCRKK